MNSESEIETQVAALKAQFSDTKALYREVCALLFFRHGIAPTTNKLYQYVRKGSMSAPAQALATFWEELRGKARVQIDHPDLPEALKAATADAVQVLWTQATEHARVELAALRLQSQADVQVARDTLTRERDRAAQADQQGESQRRELEAAAVRLQDLGTEIDAERRSHASTAARAQELQRQAGELQAQLERARADFSAELEKVRRAVGAADERADAAQRRALLEIDQERMAKAKLDKQVQALRAQVSDIDNRHRAEQLEQAASAARTQTELDAARLLVRDQATLLEQRAAQLVAAQRQLGLAQQEAAQYQAEARILQGLMERFKPAEPAQQPRRTGASGSKTKTSRSA